MRHTKTRAADLRDFIEEFSETNGYPPSYAEMCEGLGLKSKGSIFNLIQQLREEGKLDMRPGMARTVTVRA